MNRWCTRFVLVLLGAVLFPHICPAPIIYRPGEGWTYEPVGSEGKWTRNRARDQLQVAKDAMERHQYKLATKAARRVVKVWPLSDYAAEAQFLVGQAYEERKKDEKAFKEYQRALIKYPKITNYTEVLERQYAISDRYLAGQWFKLWGYIPAGRSMEKTAKMFEQVANNGPYQETGPKAQLNVGTAQEKRKEYPLAVKAYEKAADRYRDRPAVSSEAMYRAGMAYRKQAQTADYDQSTAGNAIATLKDFQGLYPDDKRVTEADKVIATLRTEQARGAFETAKFYERRRRWQGAVVYYNEVVARDPNSPHAAEARERIAALKPKADAQTRARAEGEKKWRELEKAASQKPETVKPGDTKTTPEVR
jgi:outer membrane assembly lipoprotein YfiO